MKIKPNLGELKIKNIVTLKTRSRNVTKTTVSFMCYLEHVKKYPEVKITHLFAVKESGIRKILQKVGSRWSYFIPGGSSHFWSRAEESRAGETNVGFEEQFRFGIEKAFDLDLKMGIHMQGGV